LFDAEIDATWRPSSARARAVGGVPDREIVLIRRLAAERGIRPVYPHSSQVLATVAPASARQSGQEQRRGHRETDIVRGGRLAACP
jgi:hypothetical protein